MRLTAVVLGLVLAGCAGSEAGPLAVSTTTSLVSATTTTPAATTTTQPVTTGSTRSRLEAARADFIQACVDLDEDFRMYRDGRADMQDGPSLLRSSIAWVYVELAILELMTLDDTVFTGKPHQQYLDFLDDRDNDRLRFDTREEWFSFHSSQVQRVCESANVERTEAQ